MNKGRRNRPYLLFQHAHTDKHVRVVHLDGRRCKREFDFLADISHLLFEASKAVAFELRRCNHRLLGRVHPVATIVLEAQVQMRTRAAACRTHLTNDLTRRNLRTDIHATHGKMHVPAFSIVPVADGNLITAQIIVTRYSHNTCGDRINRRALGATVVDTVMHRATARNRVDAGTIRARDMQTVERVTEAFSA